MATRFRVRPLCFFRGQYPRHRHCFQLTHRFDAVLTDEVALKFEACKRNVDSNGFPTPAGIIDQRDAKTYVIARQTDRVLESDLSTQSALHALDATEHQKIHGI